MQQVVDPKLQRSSSSSITDNDDDDDAGGPPSVFLLLDNHENSHFSIQQVKLNKDQDTGDDESLVNLVQFNEHEDKNEDERRVRWFFSPPTSSTGDMYVLPKWPDGDYQPNHAFKFNFKTCCFQKIKHHLSPKWDANAVNLDGLLYYMEQPEQKLYPGTDFECYDPVTNTWKALKPFPNPPSDSQILATAVLKGTILFNVATLHEISTYLLKQNYCEMWAYNVRRNAWYRVDVGDDERRCCSIEGEAVVIGNTIYALTSLYSNSLLALSIKKEKTLRGLKFTCSVVSRIRLKGMTPEYFHDETWTTSRQLVHLRKDDFCLVQSCLPVGEIEYQPINLTFIKREGKSSMRLTHVKELKIKHCGDFSVLQAFSLPKGMTAALEEGDKLVIPLDSFSDTFVSTQEDNADSDNADSDNADSDNTDSEYTDSDNADSDNTDSDNADSDSELEVVKPVQEGENLILPPKEEEGHANLVKKFPNDVNDATATSKQRAIEPSTSEIGGRQAKIFDSAPFRINTSILEHIKGKLPPKRGLQRDKNKFNNRGEVSLSSTVDTMEERVMSISRAAL